MENTHKSPPSFQVIDGKKFDFNLIWSNFMSILNPAVELFKKDALNFILIFAVPVIIGGLLANIVFPTVLGGLILSTGIIGMLLSLAIFVFCSIVLSLIAYLALVKAVIEKSKGNKIDLSGVFSFAANHAIGSVTLSIKTFLTIFGGWKKFVNSLLSLIYFMESAKPNADEALKSSQATCEGKSVSVIWNFLLIGFATSIVSSIISSVWVGLTSSFSYSVATLGYTIAYGVVTSFTILYHFVMKTELEKLKK